MSTSFNKSNGNTNEDEVDIYEIFKILSKYKFSILVITLLFLLSAIYIIYFRTPKYQANSLIEIKSATKDNINQDDFIGETFNNFGAKTVDKEIEILQTFHINNLALNKVHYGLQFFKIKAYKKVEVIENIPIVINDLNVTDDDVLGHIIKLDPRKNGYYLTIENSYKNKILNLLFGKEIPILEKHQLYPYNQEINTSYFSCSIQKKDEINEPIFFIMKGDNRQIFEDIKKNLQITQPTEFAPLIRINYEDTKSKRAASYVNALVDSFISQSVAEKSKSSNRIINFIISQLATIKNTLKKNEDALEEYKIKHRAVQPELQGRVYIEKLTDLDLEISKNELRSKLIGEMITFSGKKQNLVSIAPALQELNDDPTLNLVKTLQEAQLEMEGLRSKYSMNHPDILSLNKRINNIKQKIIYNLKKLKSNMISRNDNLMKLKELYDNKLKSLPTLERKLLDLKRDHEVSSGIYKYLLQKKAENQMINVAILSNYRVIDRAYTDNMPIGAKPTAILIAAFLLGLIIGSIQAMIRSYLNDKILSIEDIVNATNVPIYASLPALKQKKIKLEVMNKPKSPLAESYRNLRTNLQFAKKDDDSIVVLVSSTIMGEGKSTTTANLSAIFQMAGYKSIVINLDMRKPTLHTYFDVDNTYGMSTYLSGKNNVDEIIFKTEYNNLDFIPSGPVPPNPSELILTKKLDFLINNLKQKYDYIFIDSAPLGLVADTLHLMKYSDITLMIIRYNYSKKSFLHDLNMLIDRHDLKNLGIVFNGLDISSTGYGYGYGE